MDREGFMAMTAMRTGLMSCAAKLLDTMRKYPPPNPTAEAARFTEMLSRVARTGEIPAPGASE